MLYDNFMRAKMKNTFKYAEIEGYPCQFVSSGGKLKNYVIFGNTLQNGTPTPDNSVEIQNVGDLIIEIQDENLGKYQIPILINEKTTKTIYLKEPLRKIDDYADYAEYKYQKVVRNVREFVFADNENQKQFCKEYTYGTDMDNTYHFHIRNMNCVNRCSMYCNVFRAGNITMNYNATDSFFTSQYSATGSVYIQMEKALIDNYEGETTVDKLWNYLIDNNAIIVYATTTVSEKSADLPPVTVPNGNVILKTDTTIEPSKITVKYKK